MTFQLVFDIQGAKRMTSDMAPKPTFIRGNSENLCMAPVDPPIFNFERVPTCQICGTYVHKKWTIKFTMYLTIMCLIKTKKINTKNEHFTL